MSREALLHYERWMRERYNPRTLYLTLCALIVILLSTYAAFCRTGGWALAEKIGLAALVLVAMGVIVIWGMQQAVLIGGWVLLEKLENGYRLGKFREVWYVLMTRYRGLAPQLVGSERFHRLFVGVGSAIVKHEELTVWQSNRMSELLALANANLSLEGGVIRKESMSRFFRPLMITMWISLVVAAVWRLVDFVVLFSKHRE
jgi:hypothetical protein